MQTLTEHGREIARAAAERHGVSAQAAAELLRALALGGGAQAQFSHPELGGMGQWSRGGMLMIGDMFNNALKARVDALANDLAGELAHGDVLRQPEGASVPGGQGWPAEFGAPASSGAQNDMRYAFFPETRRLAIVRHGAMEVYDSGEHRITGVGQQQGGDQSISFSTAEGPVRLHDLRRLDAPGAGASPSEPVRGDLTTPAPGKAPEPAPEAARAPAPPAPSAVPSAAPAEAPPAAAPRSAGGQGDVFDALERLADLRNRGILTEEEFAAKKKDLLARL
ncbi:SHOCT domain-containing protein [Amaricoccus solimangrovi]|uniref:SHOCT domain-containing protein n=1 Tax=Amaricoccus solimangrovi TaxID=2589815 RepID=A0A501WLS9_9RHOB|nr:SHOCT domain-containing protein [Amaricoccus solimangrovi]TPE49752.1 SHOCT domain-containing protein [Amaricoccus solimangrovi]